MSYTDMQTTPAERLKAIAGTGSIQALIVLGVATGFTITGQLAPPDEPIPTFDVTPDAVVPPAPPVDTPETPTYSAPTASTAPLDLTDRNPVEVERFQPDLTSDSVARIVAPIPLPTMGPALPQTVVSPKYPPAAAVPRNGPLGWISNTDYPRRDLTRGNEGSVAYTLVIGSDGMVDACEITASSGHSGLDNATCQLIERRARFDPATGSAGTPIVGTFAGSVTWEIPQ